MSRRYCTFAVVLFLFSFVYGSAQQPAQTQPAPENKGTAPATITREQADAILNELRLIRRLLETNGRPTTAAAPRPTPRPQAARLPVASGWHAIGRDDAPLTLVEFMDYQCPYCRRFHTDSFAELKKQYIDTGKLRFVVRDLPLAFHPNALPAAEAVRCAGEQGKFWEMREALMLNSNDLSPDSISRYAKDTGVDADRLRGCVQREKYKAEIQKDASAAAAASLSGTPSFVLARTAPEELNGEVIIGAVPFAVFDAAIKRLLATPAALTPSAEIGGKK